MMKRKHQPGRVVRHRAALIGAAWLLLGGASTAGAQLSVSPVILPLTVGAQTASRTVSVTNAGTEPLSVRFYAGDFEQDVDGANRFADLGTLSHSCGERIRVYPDAASLLPGETHGVRVDLAPGAEVCWSAVFVETAAVAGDGRLVRQRVAVKAYGIRPDARLEGEVTDVAIEQRGPARTLVVSFRNLGDAPLRPEGSLEIRTFAGEVAARVGVGAFSVLPGRVRRVEIPVPEIGAAGEYIAVPVLDFGGEYLAGGQLVFRAGSR